MHHLTTKPIPDRPGWYAVVVDGTAVGSVVKDRPGRWLATHPGRGVVTHSTLAAAAWAVADAHRGVQL